MYSPEIKVWLEDRAQEDARLYKKYGKPLESDHKGEFVAIGPDGHVILGEDSDDVLKQAIATFGRGNFALARVGERAFGKWFSSHP